MSVKFIGLEKPLPCFIFILLVISGFQKDVHRKPYLGQAKMDVKHFVHPFVKFQEIFCRCFDNLKYLLIVKVIKGSGDQCILVEIYEMKLYQATPMIIECRTISNLLTQCIFSYFNARPEMNFLITFVFFITLITLLMQRKHGGLMFLLFLNIGQAEICI